MSSLTIEMGLSRRKGEPPPVPDRLANRNDMTLAQKQRLAVLAKMGVGPVADAPPALSPSVDPRFGPPQPAPPIRDRRMELLEKERRLREQEERQEELDEQEFAKRAKRARPQIGMSRLGPVMPREDNVPQVPPTPATVPDTAKQWTLKISKDTADRVAHTKLNISKDTAERVAGAKAAEPVGEEFVDEEEKKNAEAAIARIQKERERRAALAKQERERQEKQRQGKKKKKSRKNKDEDWEEYPEGESGEEDVSEPEIPERIVRRMIRDTAPGKMMVVESVKGKVSTANKNLTDADLERRFSLSQDGDSSGSLMTEEQVLKIIRREKQERGAPTERGGASASRRVQRELDEWADKKAQQRARVKSPHRFERMVIARK